MIRLRYFASLRERLSISSEEIDMADLPTSVERLIGHLVSRGEPWEEITRTRNLRVAINQTMAPKDAVVRDGDEVAFFPPVTGG